MNKLLIVLLAVCLVSTHAFVKRDAPAAANNENYLETIQKTIVDFSKDLNTQMTEAFNPENVKKKFNEFIDGLNITMNELKTKPAQ